MRLGITSSSQKAYLTGGCYRGDFGKGALVHRFGDNKEAVFLEGRHPLLDIRGVVSAQVKQKSFHIAGHCEHTDTC